MLCLSLVCLVLSRPSILAQRAPYELRIWPHTNWALGPYKLRIRPKPKVGVVAPVCRRRIVQELCIARATMFRYRCCAICCEVLGRRWDSRRIRYSSKGEYMLLLLFFFWCTSCWVWMAYLTKWYRPRLCTHWGRWHTTLMYGKDPIRLTLPTLHLRRMVCTLYSSWCVVSYSQFVFPAVWLC